MEPNHTFASQPPLSREFYDRDVVLVARELLATHLFRVSAAGVAAGRIVEVEAYLAADDPANHAYRGRNRRNASMLVRPAMRMCTRSTRAGASTL